MTKDLGELEKIHGFRQRGAEMTRIEVFTDAAFAFAVTLLVVSIDEIPDSYDGLLAILRGVPAFAFSFAILFMFWYSHHSWSKRYGLDDGATILLSGVLVFLIMVYVYPLKMISNGFAATVFGTDGSIRLRSIDEAHNLFIIYGIGFTAMALTVLLLYLHAWRLRDELDLNIVERHVTLSEMKAAGAMMSVGLLSVLLSVFPPPNPSANPILAALSGWVYMLLAIVMPVLGVTSGKRQAALLETMDEQSDSTPG